MGHSDPSKGYPVSGERCQRCPWLPEQGAYPGRGLNAYPETPLQSDWRWAEPLLSGNLV